MATFKSAALIFCANIHTWMFHCTIYTVHAHTCGQHYLAQVLAICLPGVKEAGVLGQVSAVNAAANAMVYVLTVNLLSVILILAGEHVRTRLIYAIIHHALASAEAEALGSLVLLFHAL